MCMISQHVKLIERHNVGWLSMLVTCLEVGMWYINHFIVWIFRFKDDKFVDDVVGTLKRLQVFSYFKIFIGSFHKQALIMNYS